MGNKSFQQEFEAQLKKLTEIASTATSPTTTATVIAASDDRVKDLVLKKLDAGSSLSGVWPLMRQRSRVQYMLFVVDRAAPAVNLIPESFLVVVDLGEKRVVQIEDPYLPDDGASYASAPYISAPTGGLPFAMKVPSNSTGVVRENEARAPYRAMERAFFQERGIQPGTVVPQIPGDPSGPGGGPLPGLPPIPGFPGRPGRGPGFVPPFGTPSPAATKYHAFTETQSDTDTTTTTDDPPKSDDGMTDDGGPDDNRSDYVPFD